MFEQLGRMVSPFTEVSIIKQGAVGVGVGICKSLVLDMLILKYKLDIQIHWAGTMRICSGTLIVSAESISKDTFE